MIMQKIIDTIVKSPLIIIHHHVSPDPDTIGSQLGLKYILQESFPEKHVYAVGNHNAYTAFLGELDRISDDLYQDALVIIVDVAGKNRIDDSRFKLAKEIIVIDHHLHPESLTDLIWSDSSYSATAEMIIDLYVMNQDLLKMNENAARCLYAGLLTDTGRFYYQNVTPRTLLNGALIYNYGFDKQALYSNIYFKSINEVKFIGYLNNQFESTKNGLGYMKLNHELLETYHVSPDFASGMVNTLSDIKGISMWIFFIEYVESKTIRVEFRSRGIVVNELAIKYGGGGHALASGAIAPNWETVDAIVRDADLTCKKNK